ncbi:glycoside hydrolase family 16 protein [Caulobacter sp. Root1455]|uniref:glycoside hydrolase family 16 protein n=1 Tax=Caulobacter sp. Root1455 TaxID=1736465 RepID=UPI0009E72E21|nr:glycoside hydrolase family 16 protein [Caulobacter sp. Root1455]
MSSAPRRMRAVGMAVVVLAGAASALAAWPQESVGGPPAGFSLTPSFNEEFDGAALDTTRWRTAYRTDGVTPPTVANRSLYGNRERELYFDPAFLGLGVQPFSVADGALTITAAPMSPSAREAVAAAVAQQPESIRNSPLKDVSYSSGLITTKGSFSQLYGYFEIRARWTGGKGLWPAFWALPADGGWPPELDVMEALGHEPTTVYQSVHSKQTGAAVGDTTRVAVGAGTSAFHTYGMLWTKDEIRFYLDGRQTAARPTPTDAHKPMYLMANLAVGGYWPGDPTATTPFPATMTIDYVRAWKLAE